MSDKVFISVALTGANSDPKFKNVPVTPEEIAKDAVACAQAGASVLHIHTRNPQKTYQACDDFAVWQATYEAVKDACIKAGVQPIINFTTANAPLSDIPTRLAAVKAFKPELCSMDSGSLNWGKAGVWANSPEFLDKLSDLCLELDVRPEIELMDTSMLLNAKALIKEGKIKTPAYFQIVLGTAAGLDGSIREVEWLRSQLPEGSLWSITGIGKNHMRCMLAGLAADADGIRVGLEDNVYLTKGVEATNVQLVQRAADMIRLTGKQVATVEETRQILGLKRTCW